MLFKKAFSIGEGEVDQDFLEKANHFLELVMLRRMKDSAEVGVKLPPKTEIALSVPLSESQHSWYLRILGRRDQLLSGERSSSSVRQKFFTWLRGPAEQSVQQVGTQKAPREVRNVLMELRKASAALQIVCAADLDSAQSILSSSTRPSQTRMKLGRM